MYVYLKSQPKLFTVGHYIPAGSPYAGKWMPESDHTSEEKARERVITLNGGGLDVAALLAGLDENECDLSEPAQEAIRWIRRIILDAVRKPDED